MKYIITESQLELLSELDRNWMDAEYSEQYNEIKDNLIPFIQKLFKAYSENDTTIDLVNKNKDVIVSYYKKSGELFYDNSIDKRYSDLFPHPMWSVHRKYLIADMFESFFPDYKVRSVRSANFGKP